MEERRYLSKKEMYHIPLEDFPFMVVSYGIGSAISAAIVVARGGLYNHWMWLYRPKRLASQGAMYEEVRLHEYLSAHSLKLWTNINWTPKQKARIIGWIRKDLARPWYQRVYDFVGCTSQLGGKWTNWVQIPGWDYCSEGGNWDYLARIDKEYKLKRPTPAERNQWLSDNYDRGYRCYGRYRPD